LTGLHVGPTLDRRTGKKLGEKDPSSTAMLCISVSARADSQPVQQEDITRVRPRLRHWSPGL